MYQCPICKREHQAILTMLEQPILDVDKAVGLVLRNFMNQSKRDILFNLDILQDKVAALTSLLPEVHKEVENEYK